MLMLTAGAAGVTVTGGVTIDCGHMLNLNLGSHFEF